MTDLGKFLRSITNRLSEEKERILDEKATVEVPKIKKLIDDSKDELQRKAEHSSVAFLHYKDISNDMELLDASLNKMKCYRGLNYSLQWNQKCPMVPPCDDECDMELDIKVSWEKPCIIQKIT